MALLWVWVFLTHCWKWPLVD